MKKLAISERSECHRRLCLRVNVRPDQVSRHPHARFVLDRQSQRRARLAVPVGDLRQVGNRGAQRIRETLFGLGIEVLPVRFEVHKREFSNALLTLSIAFCSLAYL